MDQKVQNRRRIKRKRSCFFCVNKINVLDYKKIDVFERFLTDRGKIFPRRNSGICAKHQRMFAQSVKRARYMGLIPYRVD